MRKMDYREMLEWMAYDMASNPEFREKIYKEIALEEQRKATAEEQANRIINFFKGLGNGK